MLTAAGLSYFTLISLVPAIIITLTLAGHVLSAIAARTKMLEEIANWFSSDVATSVQTLLGAVDKHSGKATIFSILFLLWAAIRMFTQIQDALNVIWDVHIPKGPHRWFMSRARAVGMVGVFSMVVLGFLWVDISIAVLKKSLIREFPVILTKIVIPFGGFLLSTALFAILFAMVFKILPEKRLAWKNAFVGGMVSSLLFAAGRFLIAFYFSHSLISTLYGAAGSVIILLIWIYFSMQIFLFGAEFTRVYAERKTLVSTEQRI